MDRRCSRPIRNDIGMNHPAVDCGSTWRLHLVTSSICRSCCTWIPIHRFAPTFPPLARLAHLRTPEVISVSVPSSNQISAPYGARVVRTAADRSDGATDHMDGRGIECVE